MRWMAILARDTLVVWGMLFTAIVIVAAINGGSVVVPGWVATLGPLAAWVRAEMCGWHE